MKTTATKLRADLYKVLDRIAETGESVEVERKGVVFEIVRRVKTSKPKAGAKPAWKLLLEKIDKLEPHPGYIIGDPEGLVHMDWSQDWKPHSTSTRTQSHGSGKTKKRRTDKPSKPAGRQSSRSRRS